MIDLESNSTSKPRPPIYPAEWLDLEPEQEKETLPVLLELGASLVNRDARHSSDISHNSAQIEKLRRQMLTGQIIWVVIALIWLGCTW
jgi:hypothetical protein